MDSIETDVCIAGGGPAGMVSGLLLARHGVRVVVLEQQADFRREYRGEILLPRFAQTMRQAGLFDFLEKYPHLKLESFELSVEGRVAARVPVSGLSSEAPFLFWMPQPVMLGAFLDKSREYPSFRMMFNAEADTLIRENGRVTGVNATMSGKTAEIRAKITVGADGRGSVVLKRGGFELDTDEHDFDVIWFTIPKPPGYTNTLRGFLSRKRNYLMLPKYPDDVQCGLIVAKNEYIEYRKKGLESIRKDLLDSHPMFREFAEKLTDFKPFNVLQARVHFVKRWAQDGCLLVGDAAHTCSPAGAIGVSVAVATAIVAADVIRKCLAKNDVSAAALGEVQRLREAEVRTIQSFQKNFTRLITGRSRLGLTAISILGRLNLIPIGFRRMATTNRPLPVSSDL